MKNKAINALIEMGMPANIKGFHYIAEAMALLEEDPPSWKPGKTGKVYRRLSEMSGDTPSKVERAIRHAFTIVLTEGYLDAVEKYLTLQNTTNGNLLATLYLRLSQEKGKEK